jgi:F-type H+-transporting ATPase subunit epsilon
MAGTFHFELVSPEKVLLSEAVDQVVLPGADGDFAVLAGHAPLISTLRPGIMDITSGGKQRRIFVKAGFVEVDPARLTVLAERAQDVSELNVTAELEAARVDLAAATDDAGRARAESALTALRGLEGGKAH